LHLLQARLGELARERAELLGERDERLEARRLLGRDRGEVHRVGDRAAQEIIRHLLGDLQRDGLLRLGGGGAEIGGAHGIGVAGSSTKTSKAAPATWPESSAARSAASSTRPPRAQLTMRTPLRVFAIALASMMLLVFSVSGVCSVMKSARRRSSSSSTFSTPRSIARSC